MIIKPETRKKQQVVWITAAIGALLVIFLLLFLPIKFWNTALRKESEEKNEQVNRLIDLDIFPWTK